jgi:hypothetical protein
MSEGNPPYKLAELIGIEPINWPPIVTINWPLGSQSGPFARPIGLAILGESAP